MSVIGPDRRVIAVVDDIGLKDLGGEIDR